MNPDVAAALDRFVADGVLSEATAAPLRRVARRELVSVRFEVRGALYIGVILMTSGIGLLVKENYERIGPLSIALVLAAISVACLSYCAAKTAPFTWSEVPSPTAAFDYVLLLGLLVAGSDLAYVESQFGLLGRGWAWHFLIVAFLYGLAAYRFDSRMALSLALTSFAAWRGVAISLDPFSGRFLGGSGEALRWNAIACGGMFLVAGFASVRSERKAHFEAVFTNLGLFLVLGALVGGAWENGTEGLVWLLALGFAGVFAARRFYALQRGLPFSMAAVALYLGSLRVIFRVLPDALAFFAASGGSLAAVVLLVVLIRKMKDDE